MERKLATTNTRLDLGASGAPGLGAAAGPAVEPATPRRRTRRVEFESKSERRMGILAHSLYRDMKAQGFVTGEIVSFASALLGELISDIEAAQGYGQVASEVGHDP
jgi:hypothetical protein